MATHPKLQTLFFAGTDTDVGKTYVAALAARRLRRAGRRVAVYKPVASGCVPDATRGSLAEDAVKLWEAAGRPGSLQDVCPQRFLAPLAPPQAAAAEGRTVDASRLRTDAERCMRGADVLIVEGAGGLLSPLADGVLNFDLFRKFESAKLCIVAADRLGVIHQTLATCEAAIGRGVVPSGIVLSQTTPKADPSVAGNAEQITRYCRVPIVARVGFDADETAVDFLIDWVR